MSGSSAVEIDFFRINAESYAPKKLSDRRDIQGVVSKINPELLKTAIATASANMSFVSSKSCSSPDHQLFDSLPVFNQDSGGVNMARYGAPMTIFYNGTVSVFDVTPTQVENIVKLAESGSSGSKAVVEPAVVKPPGSSQSPAVGGALKEDLPMSRKKSLRRFLEKRKERQVSVSPYSKGNASLH
ncbi:hypothetical protein LXL04_025722 [Taraxacum kok-saghyz]